MEPSGARDAAALRDRLESAARTAIPREEALAMFDRLSPAAPEDVLGRWRGRGVHTGHPLDGALEAFGWQGKDVRDRDAVFPLLFDDGRGGTVALDPAWLPLRLAARWRVQDRPLARALFPIARRLLHTTQPGARLRMVHCRGQVGAALVYDRLPVIDALRRVDERCLLGLMDCRYFSAPLFFLLQRE